MDLVPAHLCPMALGGGLGRYVGYGVLCETGLRVGETGEGFGQSEGSNGVWVVVAC